MRIQHNIAALNAHRQLGNNNNAVSKNLEKLSSGFRINRAGDDAAGLAISEKMRGQIRGLDMAGRNANDGISLIQTAEGALAETHSILQRVRELAVQSSNGTYEEGVVNSDRDQLDKEVQALKSEIDRIADSTHFNNKKLLNGNLSANGVFDPNASVADKLPTLDGANGTIGAITAGKNGQEPSAATKAVFTLSGSTATKVAGAGTLLANFGSDSSKADVEALTVDGVAVKDMFDVVENSAGNITLTAKTAGALSDDMLTAITGTYAKGGNASVVTEGVDQGKGAGATSASYELKIDFAALEGGDSITIGDKKIIFTDDAAITTTGVFTDGVGYVNIGNIKSATETTARGAMNTAADAVSALMGTLTSEATDDTAVTATNVQLKANEKVATIKINTTGTGAAANMGALREAKTTGNGFTVSQTSFAKDETRGKEAKFATASIDVDFSKFKAGDKIKVGDKAVTFISDKDADGNAQTAKAGEVLIKSDGSSTTADIGKEVVKQLEAQGYAAGKIEYKAGDSKTNAKLTFTATDSSATAAETAALATNTVSVEIGAGNENKVDTSTFPTKGVTFQIGANGGADQRVTLSVADQHCETLGIGDIKINTQVGANSAIDLIDKATGKVSATRADLGALQNRLEHTVSNLGTSVENLTAAESRIRDVDMAKEMMEMTKNNILSQAAQSMLAQANTQPQSVLQLLQ